MLTSKPLSCWIDCQDIDISARLGLRMVALNAARLADSADSRTAFGSIFVPWDITFWQVCDFVRGLCITSRPMDMRTTDDRLYLDCMDIHWLAAWLVILEWVQWNPFFAPRKWSKCYFPLSRFAVEECGSLLAFKQTTKQKFRVLEILTQLLLY